MAEKGSIYDVYIGDKHWISFKSPKEAQTKAQMLDKLIKGRGQEETKERATIISRMPDQKKIKSLSEAQKVYKTLK